MAFLIVCKCSLGSGFSSASQCIKNLHMKKLLIFLHMKKLLKYEITRRSELASWK